MTVEDDLRAVMAEFERSGVELKAAEEERLRVRDEGLRKAHVEGGWRQVDIIRFTNYSRETVRQALDPAAKEAARAARTAKKSRG